MKTALSHLGSRDRAAEPDATGVRAGCNSSREPNASGHRHNNLAAHSTYRTDPDRQMDQRRPLSSCVHSWSPIKEFTLEGGEEALGEGVVVAVAD
jgi:hypothetical protein